MALKTPLKPKEEEEYSSCLCVALWTAQFGTTCCHVSICRVEVGDPWPSLQHLSHFHIEARGTSSRNCLILMWWPAAQPPSCICLILTWWPKAQSPSHICLILTCWSMAHPPWVQTIVLEVKLDIIKRNEGGMTLSTIAHDLNIVFCLFIFLCWRLQARTE